MKFSIYLNRRVFEVSTLKGKNWPHRVHWGAKSFLLEHTPFQNDVDVQESQLEGIHVKVVSIVKMVESLTSVASVLCSLNGVGAIVYNRAKVYMHQHFLKVVVHVIIIGQWNQTARYKYEMQVNVYFLRVKRVICKTWTGPLENSPYPDQTSQNTASDRYLYCLLQL